MGLIEGLFGKVDYAATSPSYSTKPGEAAIALQLRQAAEQSRAAGYGLAAGSRGPGTALALREAQRRGMQAIQGAGNQAAIQSRQLEQEALIARGQAQMQAQQINAQIAQGNAERSQPLYLAAAAAAGGALSDERYKILGENNDGGLRPSSARSSVLDYRPSKWTYEPVDGSGLSEEELDRNAAIEQSTIAANERYLPGRPGSGDSRGASVRYVTSDPGREAAVGDYMFANGGGSVTPGMYERPTTMQAAAYGSGDIGPTIYETPGVSTSVSRSQPQMTSDKSGGLSSGAKGGLLGLFLSDARAKTLEDENTTLRSRLASATDALASVGGPVYGAPAAMAHATLPPARLQHLPIPQRQDAKAQVHDEASAAEYGRQWENSRRFAMEQDLANQVAQQQAAQQAQAQLAQAQAQSAAAQSRAGVIQAGGYPMAPQEVASDERGKSAGRMEHLQFPNGVEPVAFHYKPGLGDGPDQHYGVLAQDLERSKEGATTVREDPGSGMKMVDTNRLTMLNTAKLAEFEHRLRKMGA